VEVSPSQTLDFRLGRLASSLSHDGAYEVQLLDAAGSPPSVHGARSPYRYREINWCQFREINWCQFIFLGKSIGVSSFFCGNNLGNDSYKSTDSEQLMSVRFSCENTGKMN
jgi:hypothetical protein